MSVRAAGSTPGPTNPHSSTEATKSPAPPATGEAVDPLEHLQLDTANLAVVGLQWGDEGKGKIVDLLTGRFDQVVRYNGGANAGHSVQVGEVRYALHLIPSGILNPARVNVIANGVVIDPAQLLKEITDLRQRDVAITGENLRISDRAHVVFPYHKVEDVLFDEAVAKAWEGGASLGTTGRGIGPCYADKALRSTAIRMGDLLQSANLKMKLTRTVAIKNAVLAALAKACGKTFEPFDADALYQEATSQAEQLGEHICDTASLLHDSMDGGKRVLFEGANATLLDIDHGTYPYVTSSNCSSLGVHTGTGVPGNKVPHVLGIMKAYQTRVGGGPMPTELHDATGDKIREQGKEFGTTTGRPRRCGWLDLVTVKYSAMLSGATGLGVMLLDVLAGLPQLKVCTGYRHAGKTLPNFPADAGVLGEVEPIYEELEGFTEPIDTVRNFADLPAAAQAYIERIEKFVGVPVRVISVGPRRDQTLVR